MLSKKMEHIVQFHRGVILFLLLFSFLPINQYINLFAQERNHRYTLLISGKIIDEQTKEPIVGVVVSIKDLCIGSVTNSMGEYSLKVPKGSYTLTVSHIGYQKEIQKITLIDSPLIKNFHLKGNNIDLGEVVIKAQKSNKAHIKEIRESPMAVTVVDGRKMMGRSAGIEDILTKASGLTIRKEGGLGSSSKVSIHGLEGKRVAIFIDGFALNSPEGSFDINDLPIDVIDRIEVYKGIVPAEYGGDGLGGAINIVTREVNCDMVGGIAEIGSYGNRRLALSGKKLFEKTGIQLSLAFLHNRADNNYPMDLRAFDPDYPEVPYSHVIRNNDRYRSTILNGSIIFTKLWFDKIELECTGYKNYKEIQAIEFDSRFAYSKGTNIMPAIKLEKTDFFVRGLNLKLSTVYADIRSHLIDTVGYCHQWDGTKNGCQGETIDLLFNNSDDRIQELKSKLNLKYSINDSHIFNVNNQFAFSKRIPKDELVKDFMGFDASGFPSYITGNITGLTYTFLSKNKRFQNTSAVKSYFLYTKIFNTDDKLSDDARSAKQTPLQTTNKTWRVGFNEGVSYEVLKGLRLKTSFEYTMRLPDQREVFGDAIRIKSAPNLKAEESRNINFGIFLDKRNFLGLEQLQLEANAFYMNTSNLIRLMISDTRLMHVNYGETLIKGFDIDLKSDFTKKWYAYFNLTYQSLKDIRRWLTSDHQTLNPTYQLDIPNIPTFYYNTGIEYHRDGWPFKKELMRVYFDYSYVGSYNNAWKLSNNKSQQAKWEIPAYHLLSAGIQQSFFNNQFSVSIQVNNILNANIYNNYKMPLPGRTFSIKFRFNWFKDKSEGGAIQL